MKALKNVISTISLFLIPFFNLIHAQKIEGLIFYTDTIAADTTRRLEPTADQPVDTPQALPKRWSGNLSLGLDATSLSLINPRQSEGEKLVTLGGMLNFAFKYQGNRLLWQNSGNVQLVVVQNGTENWSKVIDALLVNTQIGVRVRGHWYLTTMFDVQTQLLTTYDGKFIERDVHSKLTSRFFAPATVKVVPGILWKPKSYFSVLFSAISNKAIIVNDSTLAAQGNETLGLSNLGNEWRSPSDFKKVSIQMGAECRMEFNRPFANDKALIKSILDIYSASLTDPNQVVIEWFSSLDISIFKGFSFTMRSDWYYDPKVLVKIGGNVNHLDRAVSIKNSMFFKYVQNF